MKHLQRPGSGQTYRGHWRGALLQGGMSLLLISGGSATAASDRRGGAVAVADLPSVAAAVSVDAIFASVPSAVPTLTLAVPDELASPDAVACGTLPAQLAWRDIIGDPGLDAAIDRALQGNLEIREKTALLQEAQARSRVAGTMRGPQGHAAVEADHRRMTGADERLGERRASGFYGRLSFSQDLDVWGRLRDRQRAAELQQAAAQFHVADARRRVIASVTTAYWTVAYLTEKRLAFQAVQNSVDTRVDIMRARYRYGDARLDDYREASAERDAVRLESVAINAHLAATALELARLTGEAPGSDAAVDPITQRPRGLPTDYRFAHDTHLPATAGSFVAGLPHRLPDVPGKLDAAQLQCRADIRAEASVLSAFAAEAAAVRKDWYPRLELTAGLNAASPSLLSLVNAPMAMLAAAIRLPFLNPGQRHRTAEAEAQYAVAETRYLKQWQTALGDVADALVGRQRALAQVDLQRDRLADMVRAEQLAEQRYRAGEIAAAEWLSKREQQARVAIDLLAARRDHAISVMHVFQALGTDA